MTKPRKPNIPEFDQEMDTHTQTQAEPTDPADEQLDDVFREFPQNEACIELSRTTEKGGRPEFIDDIMPSDFSFGWVSREYGGGHYHVKGKYKDGSTIKRSFIVAGAPFPIKRKVPASASEYHAPQPAHVAQPASPTVEVARRDDGSYDMAALMTGMMGMMKTMVQELRSSEVEMLEKMKMYRDLFGAQEKPQTPVAEAISMIKTGIELGSAANAGDGGIPWMLILDKVQAPLTELAGAISGRLRPAPIIPAQNSVNPPTGQPAQPTGERPSMDMILQQALRSALPMLVTGAAKGTEDSEVFYCDLLLEQLPRKFYATAKAFLEKPDAIDLLEKMNPAVNHYREWFESLKDALLKALNEELAADASGTVQPEPTQNATADRSADL